MVHCLLTQCCALCNFSKLVFYVGRQQIAGYKLWLYLYECEHFAMLCISVVNHVRIAHLDVCLFLCVASEGRRQQEGGTLQPEYPLPISRAVSKRTLLSLLPYPTSSKRYFCSHNFLPRHSSIAQAVREKHSQAFFLDLDLFPRVELQRFSRCACSVDLHRREGKLKTSNSNFAHKQAVMADHSFIYLNPIEVNSTIKYDCRLSIAITAVLWNSLAPTLWTPAPL